MNIALISICFTVLPLFSPLGLLAQDFKLVKKKNSIALYERWIMHNNERVRELKAVFTVEGATTEELEMLLKNASKGTRWNDRAKQYRVIPGENPLSWQVYVQYDMPWPIKDMDCHLAYQVRKDPEDTSQTIIAFSETQNDRFPVNSKFNRITGTEGKWVAQQQGDVLAVTYFIKTDRSSHVPALISDPIVYENLFKTISDFRNILEEH